MARRTPQRKKMTSKRKPEEIVEDLKAEIAKAGPTEYVVPADVFQAVVQIIGQLPYGQVAGVMNRLMEISREAEGK